MPRMMVTYRTGPTERLAVLEVQPGVVLDEHREVPDRGSSDGDDQGAGEPTGDEPMSPTGQVNTRCCTMPLELSEECVGHVEQAEDGAGADGIPTCS